MTLPMPQWPDGRRQVWNRDPQAYAIDQERLRHNHALHYFGEHSMFVLLWKLEDLEAGLVGRCPTCYLAYDATAEAYGQSAKEKCPDCFGTTYEGGYKAKIVRPAIWAANEKDIVTHSRGEVEVQTATVQSTSDFRLRTGDYIFRADASRWRMQNLGTNHLRTGFALPDSVRTPVGYNFGQVVREDEDGASYLIPPDADTLHTLDDPGLRFPEDFTALEDIRADLITTDHVTEP